MSRMNVEAQRNGMRLRTAMAAAIAILACAGYASAQISLSTAVELALRSDPRVRMSEAAVSKAQAALDETHDVYSPTITANAGYGRGLGVPTGLPTVFTLSSQSLVFNFSQKDNIRAAASGVQAAKLALKDMRNQVEEDVLVTYLNLDNDEKRQAAMAQEDASALRLVTIVQDRLNAGVDTRITLLQSRRTEKQIDLDQLHLQDDIAALSDHLSRIIGLPGNTLTAVSSSIPALPSVASLTSDTSGPVSFGVESSMANAQSKQELAFGEDRYIGRPQVSLGVNYSRIDTGQNDYTQYYPNFAGKSENAESLYFAVTIPIFDRTHRDQANQANAEARRARYEAETERNQFLEGRSKLSRSAQELSARSDLAEIDRDLAREQLNAVLAQLSANSGSTSGPQMTREDEQKARLDASARSIDLLNAQFELNQAQINLLRQTGQLDSWLKSVALTDDVNTHPTKR